MTMEKFRMMHSQLIEHYQFIEHHLEGIYAHLSGKPFGEGLKDVETSNISWLIKEIKRLENEKGVSVITDPVYQRLEYIRGRRNFWVHNCCVDMVVDHKTGEPKDKAFVMKLIEDMQEAEQLRHDLFKKRCIQKVHFLIKQMQDVKKGASLWLS